MSDQLLIAIQPVTAIDAMFVEDVVYYTLLIERLRRFGVAIIMASQKDSKADLLGMIADQGDFKVVSRRQAGLAEAHVSMTGTPEDREYARLKLRRFGVTFDGINANAFADKQPVLERLDRLEAEAVKRGYACLHEIDRYRKTLGDRFRNVIEALEAEAETPVETHTEEALPPEMKASVELETQAPADASLPADEELPVAEEAHGAEEPGEEPDSSEED